MQQTAQVVQASVALGPDSGFGLPAMSSLQVTGWTPLAAEPPAPSQPGLRLCALPLLQKQLQGSRTEGSSGLPSQGPPQSEGRVAVSSAISAPDRNMLAVLFPEGDLTG